MPAPLKLLFVEFSMVKNLKNHRNETTLAAFNGIYVYETSCYILYTVTLSYLCQQSKFLLIC